MLRLILAASLAAFALADDNRMATVVKDTNEIVHKDQSSAPSFSDNPKLPISIDVTLVQGHDVIPIDGKVIVSNKVRFSSYLHDAKLTLLPTIDLPDLVITKILNVYVGKNLCIMGSLDPIYDYGRPELQSPGKALSVQFHLGTVMNTGTDDGDQDSDLVVEYEAEVAKPIGDDVGHVHTYGLSVEADGIVKMLYREATFVAGSVATKPLTPINPNVVVKESPVDDQETVGHVSDIKPDNRDRVKSALGSLRPAVDLNAPMTDETDVKETETQKKDASAPATSASGEPTEPKIADGQYYNSLPLLFKTLSMKESGGHVAEHRGSGARQMVIVADRHDNKRQQQTVITVELA